MSNYMFKTTGLPEPINGLLERYNFIQGVPHTKIYEGVSGLTFRRCNLTNCDVPPGTNLEGKTAGPQISFCSHIHPEWLDRGYIQKCAVSCSHLVSTDTITIDGVVVSVSYLYEDKEEL